jgi:molybdopterin-guanine dinucleotide biosynthesis protein A
LYQCRITADQYQKAGPLGGIHAAIKSTSAEAIFVFAGDMPFLDKNIIKDQVINFNSRKYDVLVPRIGKFIEPLHAIYSRQIEKSLDRYLAEGRSRSVKDFLSELNIGYFVIPDSKAGRRVFTNINSPSDITGLII